MAETDQIKWDRKYAEGYGVAEPSPFLVEALTSGHWEISPGRALDIACGNGRNTLFLAARGFDITGIDISAVGLAEARRRALARALPVTWEAADLEKASLPTDNYKVIVNFNYLQRSLIQQIRAALRPGGFVIFDTYLIDQKKVGEPKNPEYLLAHNELLEFFRGFRVLCYREGQFPDGGKISFRAGILAQKRS
jgi:tellurite methyltransferase